MTPRFQNEVPKVRINIKWDLHTGGAWSHYFSPDFK